MATRFELLMYGEDAVRLRAAGEEALREIARLEAQLSFYSSDSEITWLNAHAARGPVRVEPRLFRLLERCAELTALTDGAFDITIGPLMRAWRFVRDKGQVPSAAELSAARAVTGMHQLEFDEADFTVRFTQPGVEIDLGGYGKGYAVECAMELLREQGISSALLHGGGSSVCTIGAPPDAAAWKLALPDSFQTGDRSAIVELTDQALSVSAVYGRAFESGGRQYGHVIDPLTGEPVTRAVATAVTGPSAADCEALTKALLIFGQDWLPVMNERFPDYQGRVAGENARRSGQFAD